MALPRAQRQHQRRRARHIAPIDDRTLLQQEEAAWSRAARGGVVQGAALPVVRAIQVAVHLPAVRQRSQRPYIRIEKGGAWL